MGIKERLFRKAVEKEIAPIIQKELGDKSLAFTSRFIRGLIPTAGVGKVRKQVIKSIEDDIKRASKKGNQVVEDLIQNALSTPDYMELLKELGMNEDHIRTIQEEVMNEK